MCTVKLGLTCAEEWNECLGGNILLEWNDDDIERDGGGICCGFIRNDLLKIANLI